MLVDHLTLSIYSQGPNHVWHIDGYDKLKPFGFPIHGCVDGLVLENVTCCNDCIVLVFRFSRKINNVPKGDIIWKP